MILSLIIPIYDEYGNIKALTPILKDVLEHGHEVILVDSSKSRDDVFNLVSPLGLKYLKSNGTCRAQQMNEGAQIAMGDVLVFQHADVRLPKNFVKSIQEKIEEEDFNFGYFPYIFDPTTFWLNINAYFTKKKNFAGAGGGDQTHFMTKELYKQLGGYNENFVVMEDFDFVRRIRKLGIKPALITEPAVVSARKYQQHSYFKINLFNLIAMLMFKLNFDPNKIKQVYSWGLHKVKSYR